jgi:hypothetical protein
MLVPRSDAKNIIYGLVDPRSGCLMYIGKSTQGMKRARSHSYPGYLGRDRSRTGAWIKSLKAVGVSPVCVPLDEAVPTELPALERFWIASIRATGATLYNHTDGGEGCTGLSKSPETREKLRLANLGNKNAQGAVRSPEVRAKISRAHMGRPMNPGTKEKLRAANLSRVYGPMPPETRAKIAAKLTGRHREWSPSVEHRSKVAAARRRPVIITATGETMPSLDAAAHMLELDSTALCKYLRGSRAWPKGLALAMYQETV